MFNKLSEFLILVVTFLHLPDTLGLAQSEVGVLEGIFTTPHCPINGNVLVANEGKVVYEESFGYSDAGRRVLNHRASKFQLASVTKPLTATGVLQLKDRGKLNLDDRFVKYFADFPFPEITIRHLLSHTSGLPDFQIFEELVRSNPKRRFVNHDVIPALKVWKNDLSPPGEKWSYSNTGYCLLALLIEKLSGTEYTAYVRENIFQPAGMSASYFESEKLEKPDPDRSLEQAFLHLYDSKLQVANFADWRAFVGNGGMISTASDLLKFDHALHGGKLLKSETLAEAQSPATLNNGSSAQTDIFDSGYGLGWFVRDDKEIGRIVWHGGGRQGIVVVFLRNISKKQAVVVLNNTFNKSVYQVGFNAMGVLNGKKPESLPPVSLAQEYGQRLVESGVDEAFCRMVQLRSDASRYHLDEEEMNRLAYQLQYEASFANHAELALEVARLNVTLFPNSYNVYDTYGEFLAQTGRRDAAISMYRKSIELNPDHEEGKKALKVLDP